MIRKSLLTISTTFLLSFTLASTASASTQYQQHNMVSDIPGLADNTDPSLVNPWGISMSATSPFWISNNHSGMSTVYDGQGQPVPSAAPIIVTIPAPEGGTPPAAPTGQVFNDTTGLGVSGKPSIFIFATEDGTISGWNPGADATNALLLVDNSASGAVPVAAPALPSAPQPQPSLVNGYISNFAFAPPTWADCTNAFCRLSLTSASPDAITVTAGTQIVWTNQDSAAHTVTADDGQYHSNPLNKTQTFSQTFSTPGTYTYHCSIHPFMKGAIIVQ
jgi:hypothetical protein